jgi:hypothetical protein
MKFINVHFLGKSLSFSFIPKRLKLLHCLLLKLKIYNDHPVAVHLLYHVHMDKKSQLNLIGSI